MLLYKVVVRVLSVETLLGLENGIAFCRLFHEIQKIDTFASQFQAKKDLPPNIHP